MQVTLNWNLRNIKVDFEVTDWGSPGTMYSRNGDPGDPPEPGEIEISKAVDIDTEAELSDEEVEQLLDDKWDALWQAASEWSEEERNCEADARRDADR